MKTEVLLELLPDRRYRVTGVGRFAVSAEWDTREEALENFQRAARATVPAHAEVVSIDVPLTGNGKPPITESGTSLVADAEGWQRLQGFLADEPLFDDWQATIAARRRRADTESPEHCDAARGGNDGSANRGDRADNRCGRGHAQRPRFWARP